MAKETSRNASMSEQAKCTPRHMSLISLTRTAFTIGKQADVLDRLRLATN
jgi:hypothetical protein